jgi:hypothetical protein
MDVVNLTSVNRWPILDRPLDTIRVIDNYTEDVPTNPEVVGQVVRCFAACLLACLLACFQARLRVIG